MYSVTLWWSGFLDYYVTEVLTSRIVMQGSHWYLGKDGCSLENVQAVIKQFVLPKIAPKQVSLVLCIVPFKFPLKNVKDQLMEFTVQSEAYLNGLGIDNVRFVPETNASATRSLLELKAAGKEFTVRDRILFSHYDQDVCVFDEEEVYVIRNTEDGWRVQHMTPRNVVPGFRFKSYSKAAAACVLANCRVNLQYITHLVIFKLSENFDASILPDNIDCGVAIVNYYGKNATPSAVSTYLSKIYTNMTDDYSCYVPVCSEPHECYIKSMRCYLCYNYEDVLPRVKVHNYSVQAKSLEVVEVSRSITMIAANGRIGMKTLQSDDPTRKATDVLNLEVFQTLYPKITITRKGIRTKYWSNGIFTDLKDVNGLSTVSLKISFFETIPVIGSAVISGMKPLKYNLFDLLNVKWVSEQITLGETDLILDAQGHAFVVVETVNGPVRIAPMTILAVFLKSILKSVEIQKGTLPILEGIKLNIDDNGVQIDKGELQALLLVNVV